MENLPAPQTPYCQIILFRREIQDWVESEPVLAEVQAYRVSSCPAYGHVTFKPVNFASLYAGHCDWIARDIAARERTAQERNRDRNRKKAA